MKNKFLGFCLSVGLLSSAHASVITCEFLYSSYYNGINIGTTKDVVEKNNNNFHIVSSFIPNKFTNMFGVGQVKREISFSLENNEIKNFEKLEEDKKEKREWYFKNGDLTNNISKDFTHITNVPIDALMVNYWLFWDGDLSFFNKIKNTDLSFVTKNNVYKNKSLDFKEKSLTIKHNGINITVDFKDKVPTMVTARDPNRVVKAELINSKC